MQTNSGVRESEKTKKVRIIIKLRVREFLHKNMQLASRGETWCYNRFLREENHRCQKCPVVHHRHPLVRTSSERLRDITMGYKPRADKRRVAHFRVFPLPADLRRAHSHRKGRPVVEFGTEMDRREK